MGLAHQSIICMTKNCQGLKTALKPSKLAIEKKNCKLLSSFKRYYLKCLLKKHLILKLIIKRNNKSNGI